MVPAHSNIGRSGGASRLLWFALAIGLMSLLLSLVIHPYVQLSWWKIFRRSASVSAVATLFMTIRYIRPQSLRSLGLSSWKDGKFEFLFGLFLGFGAILVISTGYLTARVFQVAVDPDRAQVALRLFALLPAVGLIALVEELIFRGYILEQLLSYSSSFAVVGSSLAYALVHLRSYFEWPHTLLELLGLFFFGCVLALSRLRTKRLYLGMGLHASLAYCALTNKWLVTFPHARLHWLVGTSRLVNGLIPWLVLAGVAWVIIRRTGTPTQGRQGA